MATTFDDVFANSQEVYNEMMSEVTTALDNIQNAARSSYSPGFVDVDTTLAGISLEEFTTEPFDGSVLEATITKINGIKMPTLAAEEETVVSPTLTNYNKKVWADTAINSYATKLATLVANFDTPDTSYQDAIYYRDYERASQTLKDMFDIADAKCGSKGFTYPNDQSTILKIDAQQKFQFDREQIGREIVKITTDWSRDLMMFAVKEGLNLEQMQMDFTMKYADLDVKIFMAIANSLFEGFKSKITGQLGILDGQIKQFQSETEITKVRADIQKNVVDVELNKAKLKLDNNIEKVRLAINEFQFEAANKLSAADGIAKTTATLATAANSTAFAFKS